MQVSFSAQDIDELFAEWKASDQTTVSSSPYEQVIHFPEKICNGWMRRLQLRSGIDMVMQNFYFRDALSLEIQEKGNTSFWQGFTTMFPTFSSPAFKREM